MFGSKVLLAAVALLSTTTVLANRSSSQGRTNTRTRTTPFDGKIVALELFNADTDKKVIDLKNGTVIYIKDIPNMTAPSFNINAAYNGTTSIIRSVKYWYGTSVQRIDEVAPFAFCVNERSNFFPCRKLGCGNHTVTATPYARAGADGAAGASYTVSFAIVCLAAAPMAAPNRPAPAPVAAPTRARLAITSLGLVNANNDSKVVDLGNGTVVSLKDFSGMSTPSFNVNASYDGPVVSVAYWYNTSFFRIEEIAPFAFCGNNRNDYFACRNLGCGSHAIRAIPYPRNGAQGDAGSPWQVTFSIACPPTTVPDAPKAAPVPAPVPAAPAPMAPAPTGPSCPACTPSNACFNTSCDAAGRCLYTATKTCPAGQSCDPRTGNCLSQNDLRPCIGVIDESSQQDSYINAKWTEFRTAYPNRPFCLLQPISNSWGGPSDRYGLYLPPAFLNDTNARQFNITREDTTVPIIPRPPLADWYSLCKIDVYAATGLSFVGLYIDVSGSMTIDTVKNMTNNFLLKLNQSGLAFKTLQNPDEDWIKPFLTDLSKL